MTTEFRADLVWWQAFLPAWNHRCMMHVAGGETEPDVVIFTDASGNWGCGASWGNAWMQWEWEGDWVSQQIAIKELVPIVPYGEASGSTSRYWSCVTTWQ